MVPARSLLLRDAHGTSFIRGFDAVTAPPPQSRHMAQEPINQHQEPSKQPPQERQDQVPQEERRREAALVPPPSPQQLQPAGGHQVAGTSGSSSGGSSSNGGGRGGGCHSRDWLRLGLGPVSPGAASELDLFAPDRATARPRTDILPGIPPGAFLRPAMPGIPHPSIPLPVQRAGPPWLPPWSPAAVSAQPPPLLPFAHRAFYAPSSPAAGASGLDTIRVVLPRPPAAGVWFVLQAAPHQGREPFLPQIPRSYLRIKDGRVTVRSLIKYLVNKLGLENESEVEITCRGRQLPPFLTLQHVRDSILCQRDAVSPSVAPDMSTANHIMVLQYSRRP